VTEEWFPPWTRAHHSDRPCCLLKCGHHLLHTAGTSDGTTYLYSSSGPEACGGKRLSVEENVNQIGMHYEATTRTKEGK